MTSRHDDRTGHRARTAARAVGLAVVLGSGACLAGCGSAEPAAIGPEPLASSASTTPAALAEGSAGHAQAIMPGPQRATSVLDSVRMTQRGSLKSGGIIRVVSARGDLSGQRELRWVAGGVKPYRNADCTQTFQLGNNPKAERKKNLLLCWRTSTEKSVVTVLVDPKGKPSRAKAVRELNKKWKSMG
ncbi:hypothetical protein [Actinoplanes palleronii]|uniref:hypothetical protein n=1 Tax=Actinoplanes palleronii TaxID=113570 RepID=UPI0019455FDF|nr:hypothetical protein [Actinoplanes palleronii]